MDKRINDYNDMKQMNQNRPDTDPARFRIQDGGLWSIGTIYKSQCRNLPEQLEVNGIILSGHELRRYLQSLPPGAFSMNK